MTDQPVTDLSAATLAVRCANEGIPIAATARILLQPFEFIAGCLHSACSMGVCSHLPRSDWPVHVSRDERLPIAGRASYADIEFACRRTFRLTNLEAGFIAVLLRSLHVEKEKLHAVIEQQRTSRQLRPYQQEITDPKMVDVIICKLRKKLKSVEPMLVIKTNWGKGYFLEPVVKGRVFQLIGVSHGSEHDYEADGACKIRSAAERELDIGSPALPAAEGQSAQRAGDQRTGADGV